MYVENTLQVEGILFHVSVVPIMYNAIFNKMDNPAVRVGTFSCIFDMFQISKYVVCTGPTRQTIRIRKTNISMENSLMNKCIVKINNFNL